MRGFFENDKEDMNDEPLAESDSINGDCTLDLLEEDDEYSVFLFRDFTTFLHNQLQGCTVYLFKTCLSRFKIKFCAELYIWYFA